MLENINEFTKTNDFYDQLTMDLKPDFLITHKQGDVYWEHKQNRIKKAGGSILLLDLPKIDSTTDIINRIKGTI